MKNAVAKSSLPDLPKSDSKFWSEAVKFTSKVKNSEPCEHYFEYKENCEIGCKHCTVGFFF